MKKILFVDDEIKENDVFGEEILAEAKKYGISVHFIEDPEEAIEVLRSSKDYDLVLMDGVFNGYHLQGPDAVTLIRKFSDLPIIMISGSLVYNYEGVRNGATTYLIKETIIDDLKKKGGKIRKYLKARS